jgi:transcriptional regulator GlxA family with amidase domain
VNKARIRVARLAQEYIEAHYSEAVHVEDLCRVTGVGVRTLQRCFREYFNLTVSDYLKTVRLDSARRELLAAHGSDTSVTRIAMHNGCTHLGRFSVEFRERFGQSPRQALALQAGQQ